MVQTEKYLYPKLSSIYNKIMQIALAIILIVVVMNIWIASDVKSQKAINTEFTEVARNYTDQISNTITLLLTTKKHIRKNKLLNQYIHQLTSVGFIKEARLYDKSGQLILASDHSQSIRQLFGIDVYKANYSNKFIPFVSEIRATKNNQLQGYLRLTVEKNQVIKKLIINKKDRSQIERMMLLIAGLIGFLLTRGLNRFSRQGHRLATQTRK